VALLKAAFRGELPYWRAYSLFAIQFAVVLVAILVVLHWYPAPENGAQPTRPIAMLLLLLAPGLWMLWLNTRNIATGTSRLLARVGVHGALVLLVYFVRMYWGQAAGIIP
jgi:hypothetical protein